MGLTLQSILTRSTWNNPRTPMGSTGSVQIQSIHVSIREKVVLPTIKNTPYLTEHMSKDYNKNAYLMGLNRTIVGWKYSAVNSQLTVASCLNRTIVGWKSPSCTDTVSLGISGLNRTIVGWKCTYWDFNRILDWNGLNRTIVGWK